MAMPAPEVKQPAAAASLRNDPYRAYNFKLDLGGSAIGHFTRCSGIQVRVPAIPYREGGERQIQRWLPTTPELGKLELSYGLTASREVFDWLMKPIETGEVDRRHVSVVLLGNDGATELVRWNLYEAFPTEWRGAMLDALGREVAIETVTLVFERLERIEGSAAGAGA